MEINFETNEVRISVVELATFEQANRSTPRMSGQHWRAQIGREWHKIAEEQTRAQYPDADFEKSIRGKWLHKNWTFTIQGRIDQIIRKQGHTILAEVKTLRAPLPLPFDRIASEYADYLAQAQIYWKICDLLPEFADTRLKAELVLFDIDHGIVQRVPVDADSTDYLEEQTERVFRYLETRKTSYIKLRDLEVSCPFKTLREGQSRAIEQLEKSLQKERITLFNAPTGFGKTGIILQQVLKLMQTYGYDRCIYLTSRSTGQTEVARQLRAMTHGSLRWIQMRNREEHRISSPGHTCTGDHRCDVAHAENWADAMIYPRDLFIEGSFELERSKALGEQMGLCPYALTRSCLPYADFWLGDFNYVFSPSSRSVFIDCLGFDPARTILVIDEAHNLPERVASTYDVELDAASLFFAVESLDEARAPHGIQHLLERIAQLFEELRPNQELGARSFYELLEISEEFTGLWERSSVNYDLIAPFALETVGALISFGRSLDDETMRWFHWCPRKGVVRASCLSPEVAIKESLGPFGKVVLQSATFDPVESFIADCGLDPKEVSLVRGAARWREDAYEVAIDIRVDTRLKNRCDSYETTARTLADAVFSSPDRPVVAFFPSYAYAEAILEYVSVVASSIRVKLQNRAESLKDREAFVIQALRDSDLIFFIIGSHFSEGIDQLGGEIDLALVVGPAISEMNLLQNHKISSLEGRYSQDAFNRVCAIPAMRRIHQALGRLVRSPGQRAKILLHCTRFSQPIYRDLLLPEYFSETLVKNEENLHAWLCGSLGKSE